MKKLLWAGLITILLVFLILGGPVFNLKLKLTSYFGNFFNQSSGDADLRLKISELEKENENLKAQLFREAIGLDESETIKVYSSYPLNTKSEIAIAAGRKQGLAVSDVITYGENVLVGRVTKVFDSSSVVKTIFDPSWEIPVRIGKSETDALMGAGTELRLTLIPREALIEAGEPVITSGSDLPYGLMIGYIKEIKEPPGTTFKEAVVEPSLRLKDLRDVNLYR